MPTAVGISELEKSLPKNIERSLSLKNLFRLKYLLYLILFWTIPAFVFALTIHGRAILLGQESDFIRQLIIQIGGWYSWVILTPLSIYLARRFQIEKNNWKLPFTYHALFSMIIIFIYIMYHVFHWGIVADATITFDWLIDETILYYTYRAPWAFFIYWSILGVTYAYDYYHLSRERAIRESKLKAELAQAELKALRAQLHPHFIFNTLHSIGMLIRKGEHELSLNMLNGLGDLLRYVLEKQTQQIVTLEQELNFISKYLNIMKSRFQNRLKFVIECDEKIKRAGIPSLILQPLVENALSYGINDSDESGSIKVECVKINNDLVIDIIDFGSGIESNDYKQGIGISNVRNRLKQLYEDHKFELTSSSEGTKARIAIPFVEINSKND